MSRDDAREWAHSEFGHARLGDARRTARLVQMAAGVVRRPGGKVLDVFRSSAVERPGSVRLSGQRAGSLRRDMVEALRVATLERIEGYRECIVSVDGTSLKLKDWKLNQGLRLDRSPRQGRPWPQGRARQRRGQRRHAHRLRRPAMVDAQRQDQACRLPQAPARRQGDAPLGSRTPSTTPRRPSPRRSRVRGSNSIARATATTRLPSMLARTTRLCSRCVPPTSGEGAPTGASCGFGRR